MGQQIIVLSSGRRSVPEAFDRSAVLIDDGPLRIDMPREGGFEPRLTGKHHRRFAGLEDKIIAMYARGMTVQQIQGFLARVYATEVAPELISMVTDTALSEVTAWQSRALEPMYPVMFFDALRVKIEEDKVAHDKAVYLALGVRPDTTRDVLGPWIEDTEGAEFWMKVFNDLKTRGVADILIAVAGGLNGMAEALTVGYPATTLQTCIVHLIRNSLHYASWKERKELAAAIKPIYAAASAEDAELELTAFESGPWGQKFPAVAAYWRRAWSDVIPFFAFPPAVRRAIYTNNSIESVSVRLRKIIKTRGRFPSDDAASKLIGLALRSITAEWGRAAPNWAMAMNQCAILYRDRFTRPQAIGSGARSQDIPWQLSRACAPHTSPRINVNETHSQLCLKPDAHQPQSDVTKARNASYKAGNASHLHKTDER